MPTYSYQCKKCSHTFDVFHGMSATPKIKCEACGGRTERLLGTGAGLIFKGSGFYETDFKEKKGKPEKAPEKSGETAKSETTPAKSSETPKAESKKKDSGKAAASAKKSSAKS